MWGTLNKMKPYLAMVSLQFGYAGSYIIAAVCIKRGMSHYILVVYRLAFAVVTIAPFALVLEKKSRPKMTFPIFFNILMLAILEPVIDLNIYYVGMSYTSPTFTSALYNAMPAITFLMAVILRQERLKIKKVNGQAKVAGTLVMIFGSMIMTLYKGPILNFLRTGGRVHHESAEGGASKDWVKGTLLLVASCFCWSSFYIMQSFTLKRYPVELSLTALICSMGMMLATAVALVMEHRPNAWSIGWDTRLLTPAYLGIVCTGITYYVQGVVMRKKGPVFVTAFNPLSMIITAILGSFILAEELYLGSVIGAIIIVIGLYSYVWGKSKDPKAPLRAPDEKEGTVDLPKTAEKTNETGSLDCANGGSVVQENPAKDTIP